MSKTLYSQAAEMISNSRKIIALTGAGISAESGIPTFRSGDGLWNKYDPAIYGSYQVFLRDPRKYWEMRQEFARNYDSFKPNTGHKALAELEKQGALHRVITQNIDGLHSKAGNHNVIEIHGSIRESYCMDCHKEFLSPDLPAGIPPLCPCGGVIKPSTVLFGEPMPAGPMEEALTESNSCDLMLLIGTSATVVPAASLPMLTIGNGGRVIEINPEKAFHDADLHLTEKAGVALPRLIRAYNMLLAL